MDLKVDWIGGNCPVQAEGRIDGQEFYFRARGEHWSIGIGGDTIGSPAWYYEEKYPGGEYAAWWMTEDEALRFIAQAAEKYSARNGEDDGQPDEQQEWHDFNPDC